MRAALKLSPGLVTDDTKFASEGAWVDCDKARFWRGLPQTIGGWESFVSTALVGTCRSIFPWADTANVLNVAFGTNSKLEVYVGGGLYDITPSAGFAVGSVDGTGGAGWGAGAYSTGTYSSPTAGDTFPLTWSHAAYGQSLISCARNQGIYQWNNVTGTPAAAVTNAPTQNTYMLVTPQRQILALGTKEGVSGTFNPMCIRGCDIENITDWTPSAGDNAFEEILEGGGRIVAGRMVGDYVFVWTDNALHMGTFLGDPGQTYRFERLGERCGLIGPGAAVIIGQVAYWMSPDTRYWRCGVGGEPQMLVSSTQTDLTANLAAAQQDKIICASVNQFREVWWFYPDNRDGTENSRYVSMSLDGPWAKGTLARTAFVDAGPTPSPLGVDTTGMIYYHERGNSADGGAFSWYFECAPQYLGDGRLMQVKGVWPDLQNQQGGVNITIYTRLYPQSPDRTKGPYTLSAGAMKRDFLVTGRLVRMRLAGSSSPTFCRLGRVEFEASEAGAQ